MSPPRPSGAATTGYVLVTLLLVLALFVYPAFKLVEYGRMLSGSGTLDVAAQVDPERVDLGEASGSAAGRTSSSKSRIRRPSRSCSRQDRTSGPGCWSSPGLRCSRPRPLGQAGRSIRGRERQASARARVPSRRRRADRRALQLRSSCVPSGRPAAGKIRRLRRGGVRASGDGAGRRPRRLHPRGGLRLRPAPARGRRGHALTLPEAPACTGSRCASTGCSRSAA